ncbi:class I SAM-dependent methyltransferase [Microbacterium sp. CIAB417]|uniref:class I SAM-dependent methyltransferase n=1 Tax=Microbacterium sp. CIAB417 TaxID=2860287 RepID=UPI001FAD5B59|nr:class I SAM-dependent methyltransferase [Microbacterium sp. CIAB417]
MKPWSGTGEAYAASYAALCAGTEDSVLAAVEPEPTMRAVAARIHPGIRIVDAALPHLPYPDGVFHAVTANFVLNHVADPRASAAELARIAVPGGMLVATTWVRSPSWFWLDVCERAGLEPPTGKKLPAEKDFDRSTTGFAAMLGEGRWRDVSTTEITWIWRVAPEILWASAEGGVASAGAFYRALDAEGRRAFRRGFDLVAAERSEGDTVPLEHTAVVAVGAAPPSP